MSARRKSIKRGIKTKKPYLSKPVLVSCYGFKVDIDAGTLTIHLDAHMTETIQLNSHTKMVLRSAKEPSLPVIIRSFTLTPESLSLCICKKVDEIEATGTIGVDRNLRNIAVGNEESVTLYDVSKIVEIGENTSSIVGSFKRDDDRIRKKIESKYGKRRKERVDQMLNRVSKKIVLEAKEKKQAIVFEDIKGIRKLYGKGNSQSKSFRYRMNSSFPYGEFEREAKYKALWEEVPVFTLTKSETRGTTLDCPRCGERLQVASRWDEKHHRQLWCPKCKRWADRDVIAVLNISHRGLLRFRSSKGEVGEAVNGNPRKEWSSQEPVILRVDASKLGMKGRAPKHVQTT